MIGELVERDIITMIVLVGYLREEFLVVGSVDVCQRIASQERVSE